MTYDKKISSDELIFINASLRNYNLFAFALLLYNIPILTLRRILALFTEPLQLCIVLLHDVLGVVIGFCRENDIAESRLYDNSFFLRYSNHTLGDLTDMIANARPVFFLPFYFLFTFLRRRTAFKFFQHSFCPS